MELCIFQACGPTTNKWKFNTVCHRFSSAARLDLLLHCFTANMPYTVIPPLLSIHALHLRISQLQCLRMHAFLTPPSHLVQSMPLFLLPSTSISYTFSQPLSTHALSMYEPLLNSPIHYRSIQSMRPWSSIRAFSIKLDNVGGYEEREDPSSRPKFRLHTSPLILTLFHNSLFTLKDTLLTLNTI